MKGGQIYPPPPSPPPPEKTTFKKPSLVNSITISVHNSNFTSVFSKAVSHANPGTERNFSGSK